MALIARAFGSSLGTPSYDPDCDTNFDRIIDIPDITSAVKDFGQSNYLVSCQRTLHVKG